MGQKSLRCLEAAALLAIPSAFACRSLQGARHLTATLRLWLWLWLRASVQLRLVAWARWSRQGQHHALPRLPWWRADRGSRSSVEGTHVLELIRVELRG